MTWLSRIRFLVVATTASLLVTCGSAFAQDPLASTGTSSAKIDQARNGTSTSPTSPVNFQNGNAGAQNSHYIEGLSIPYRVLLDGLTPGTHTVVIGWDIRQGGKNAVDYITSPNRLEPHSQFLPTHPAEVVDPLAGLPGTYAPATLFAISAPLAVLSGQPLASFNALPAAEKQLWTYNGTVTSATYVNNADGNLGDLNATTSESRMKITFTTSVPNVVIAFGGHIASQLDWGPGGSASSINGSPYHGRVIELDNSSVGNQDRSMSTAAVLGCSVNGPAVACAGTVQTFGEDFQVQGLSYVWSFGANSSGATFVGSNTGSSVQVNVGQASGGNEGFTLQVGVSSGSNAAMCSLPVTVTPPPRATVDDARICAGNTATMCANTSGGSGPYTYHWNSGATTSCIEVSAVGTYTVTVTDAKGCQTVASGNVSLAPAAVVPITGENSVCPDGQRTYSGPDGMSSYHWSVSGGSIEGSEYGQTVTVHAGHACGTSITVSLDCGNTGGCKGRGDFQVNVQDKNPPVFSGVGEAQSIECPAQPVFSTPSANDDCSGNLQLSYQDVRTEGRCANEYTITRTWTATDACGNSTTASQAITVGDHTAPVFAALPAVSTVECTSEHLFATPSVSDACDANARLTYEDVNSPGACAGKFSITRRWTATDACGNSSTASQVINVEDHTAPVFAALPDPSTVECPNTPSFATASASDACDANPHLSYYDRNTAGACAGQYTVTRVWTAEDACGNKSTTSQSITIQDHTAPVVTCAGDITVGSCQNPVFFSLQADDACGGPVTLVATPASGSTFPAGDNVVNVVARDACGNEGRCSFHVHVLAAPSGYISGPSAACPGESVTLVGPAGYNYHWSTGATSQSIVVNASGTYTLTITDRSMGCSTTLSKSFTIVHPPVAAISGADHFCYGMPADLCGPAGPYHYAWTGPDGFTASTRCVSPTGTATYQLVITDTLSGCTSASASKLVEATLCRVLCPHTIGWWMAQCSGKANGAVKYTAAQISQIFSCVDGEVAIFHWDDAVAGFCSVINPDKIDQRSQAKRQFAGFIANMCTSRLGIRATNNEGIYISLDTPVTFTGFAAHTIGDLVKEADQRLVTLEPLSLNSGTVSNMYTQVTEAFDALNNARVPDTYCPTTGFSAVGGGASSDPNPGTPTSATAGDSEAGAAIRLYAPSPNPFTGHTRIAYAVGLGGENVDLAVFDLAGRRVKQLALGYQSVGRHEADWDGRSESGQLQQGGMYFVRARIGTETKVMPLVHMR